MAAAVATAATVGILAHRLTAADQLPTARAELDGQPARPLGAVGGATTALVSLKELPFGVRIGAAVPRPPPAPRAESTANGDPGARVRPDGHDEMTRLAASMNTMADAIGARPEDERRVGADIAHELRTPSAGMPTAVGLLEAARIDAGASRWRRSSGR